MRGNIFTQLIYKLPTDSTKSDVWTDGEHIFTKTEEKANLLVQMMKMANRKIRIGTGVDIFGNWYLIKK